MVLPDEGVADAAQGWPPDSARVQAWLDSGGDVNDNNDDGTLLNWCTSALRIVDAHVSLARTLIALGADVNIRIGHDYGTTRPTPLHHASYGHGVASLDMIRLLLDAKANPNAKDEMWPDVKVAPLFNAIHSIVPRREPRFAFRFRITRMLLRAGASLDSFRNDRTIEFVMQAKETYEPRLLEYDHWLETKALIAGVRKHGTYKKYMRAPHRTF